MSIETPCTGVCTIDPQSGLCHGCGRTLAEIAGWSQIENAERLSIMAGLPARMAEAGLERAVPAARTKLEP